MLRNWHAPRCGTAASSPAGQGSASAGWRQRVTVSPEELGDAIREAAHRARLHGDAGDGETIDIRFGEQLHTRVLAGAEDSGELNPGQIAAYVAKVFLQGKPRADHNRQRRPRPLA